MIKYLSEVFGGFFGLLAGMGVTLRYFFKKPVTVIYPKERIPMKRFKGPIAFVVDTEKNDDHKCIACNACIKTCPSRCMSLVAQKSAVDGKRVLTDFKVNYMLCSLCSLCIDVCPTDALKHDDPNYDMVSLTQRELVMDLLEPFRAKKTPLTQIPVVDPAAAVKPAAAAKPAEPVAPPPGQSTPVQQNPPQQTKPAEPSRPAEPEKPVSPEPAAPEPQRPDSQNNPPDKPFKTENPA